MFPSYFPNNFIPYISIFQQQTAAVDGAEEAVPEPLEDATPPKRSKESSALMSLLGSTYMPKEELVTQKTVFEKAQDEIKKYREVTSLPLSENPLNWWRAHVSIPFWPAKPSGTFAYLVPVSHLSGFFPRLVILSQQKGAALLLNMLTNSFSCRKILLFQTSKTTDEGPLVLRTFV